jgi:hypothetical protein
MPALGVASDETGKQKKKEEETIWNLGLRRAGAAAARTRVREEAESRGKQRWVYRIFGVEDSVAAAFDGSNCLEDHLMLCVSAEARFANHQMPCEQCLWIGS